MKAPSQAARLWAAFFVLLTAAEVLIAVAIAFSMAIFLESWVTFPWALVYLAVPCLALATDLSFRAFRMLYSKRAAMMPALAPEKEGNGKCQ